MAAFLPNTEPLVQLNIDPITAFGLKGKDAQQFKKAQLKGDIRSLMSVVDRQDAINRFTWENLPNGLTGELIERILYYRGQCIFFRMKSDDKFYVLPYTLSGSIDCYGRYEAVTPLPFGGQTKDEQDKPWINGLIKVPVYNLEDEYDIDDACIIIKDYTPGISQYITPRFNLNAPLVEVEADCIPFLRTALLNATGVQGIRVSDEETSKNVFDASNAIDEAALCGQKYIPIVGALDFQDLTSGSAINAGDFLMTMQSLDNLRLQTLGIKNGGVFTKKEHILQEEQDLNSGSDNITIEDALKQRQDACEKINNIFGLNITVAINAEEQTEEIIEEEEDDTDALSNE